jgi:LysR family transcriptional regulator for bpeEF and oprC
MQQTLIQLATYYHVVDLMSFTKAAKCLGVSKGYISKQISQLESNMNTQLLERNTRHLKLTFAGEELFKHSRNIVLEYHNATQTLASLQENPAGLLRVTAPPAYAEHVLAKQLPKFLKSYPDIQLDLKLTGEQLNLFTHKIDVAIRQTYTPPGDRIAKLLGHFQFQVCASNNYLKKYPELKWPQQLIEHSCLVYSSDEVSEYWPFVIDNKQVHVNVKPRLACNTYESILHAVLNDCGIARLPSYVIAEELKKKNIQLLFNNYMQPIIPVYAIYAQNQQISPAVRAFVDFLSVVS